MEKLPEDFKQKWIAALRSGEYKQGEGLLWSLDHEGDDCYCCLGIACKVVAAAPIPQIEFIGEKVYEDDYDDGKKYIPSGIPEMLIGSNDLTGFLASMNDGDKPKNIDKKSFSEIADWIEANL